MTQPLPTTILGRTGIQVTRLGYGAGHRKHMTETQNQAMLKEVVDSDINFIDTANDYGNSEEMIGIALSHRKSEFTLATKCGCSRQGHVWTRENLFRGLHESLERLKTDTIDIMQFHGASVQDCEKGRLVDALLEMREQGKVRWIGASTNLPDLPSFIDWGVFDVLQIPYSALERGHENWITRAAEAGIGIIIRGGVALGEPGVGKGSSGTWRRFEEAGLDELRAESESRTAFMLRYTLTHPHTHTIIVGTTSPEHLLENIQAARTGPLPPDVYAEANRRLDVIDETSAKVE